MVSTMMDLFKDPFFIGVEKDLNRLMNVQGVAAKQSYPPYDIVELGDEGYLIKMAVAGFDKEELDITLENKTLVISGEKTEIDEAKYLHKGIGTRKFTRTFALGEYMEVVSASLGMGVLHVTIKTEIPEEKKPKQITIK